MNITTKKVQRWFAPYLSIYGNWCQKGFGSRLGAAGFLAKQVLFDKVFGPKKELCIYDDGRRQEYIWNRETPNEQIDRIELFKKHYPLEMCTGGTIGYDGEPFDCCFGCETAGYAKCEVNNDLKKWRTEFMNGREYMDVRNDA